MEQLFYYLSDVVDVFELVLFVKNNNIQMNQYECYGISSVKRIVFMVLYAHLYCTYGGLATGSSTTTSILY